MKCASLTVQTGVYFRKLRRIASKERYWKFIIFAFVISFTVGAVVGGDMFTNYESTKSGFFSFTSAAIWIGIFNSIQSICREHEIIRSEYRSGMRLGAYVTAHALWQLMICVVQSGIISAAGMIFAHGSAEGLILPAPAEYFITVLLLCAGADMMGLMISAAASDAAAAMTVMPFVLILQLIMSGVLFDLSGWSEALSCLTFSKWGMCAFGSIADLNDPALPLRLNEAFPNVIRLEPEKCYEHSPANLLTSWGICAGIGLFCILACRVILWARNRPQGSERGRRQGRAPGPSAGGAIPPQATECRKKDRDAAGPHKAVNPNAKRVKSFGQAFSKGLRVKGRALAGRGTESHSARQRRPRRCTKKE